MVTPASVFLLAWSGMSPYMEAHGMLRFHPHSMRVVYNLAMFFRDVYDMHPARAIIDGIDSTETSRQRVAKDALRQEIGTLYDNLSLGKTQVERAMEITIRGMDQKYFNLHNFATQGTKMALQNPARDDLHIAS